MPLDFPAMFLPLNPATLCILIIIFLAIWVLRCLYPAFPPDGKTHLTDLRDIRLLLAPESTPLATLLHQRAVPNARLVRAFGITNTFVSSDVAVHASFTREARALIRRIGGDGGWDTLAQSAREAVEKCLLESVATTEREGEQTIRFDSFVQNVALQVILCGLFDVPADSISVRDLSVVAKGINNLWRLSKLPHDLPPSTLNDINSRLHRWIPTELYPNPIDFIIPAFETMWRVVATTVAFTHNDADALTVLRDFSTNPTRNQFEHFEEDYPSVESLVAETIRLYPPTRRISRQVAAPHPSATFSPFFFRPKPSVLVADVGTVHRDTSIWGPDAAVYNPMRHHPQTRTDAQAQALLGFGVGKLKCVASSWAPQAAGVVVAAVCDLLNKEIVIVEGKEMGGREGWEGWEVRRV